MGNFFEDVIQPDSRFHSTQPINDPALLEPTTRAAVEAIIADAAANGMALMIFETFRSQERQALLYSQHCYPIEKCWRPSLWACVRFGEEY